MCFIDTVESDDVGDANMKMKEEEEEEKGGASSYTFQNNMPL